VHSSDHHEISADDALGAEEGGEARECLVEPRRIAPGAEHLERLRCPVEARLHGRHVELADVPSQG